MKKLFALCLLSYSLVGTQTKIDVELSFLTKAKPDNEQSICTKEMVILDEQHKAILKIGDFSIELEAIEEDKDSVTLRSTVIQEGKVMCKPEFRTEWNKKAILSLGEKTDDPSNEEFCTLIISMTPYKVDEKEIKTEN